MFAYIKGILVFNTPAIAIVETGGVGYQIHIPANVYGKLPQIGSHAQLHTAYIVREQSQALYGFLSQLERDLFHLLLNVSGIGPKLALNMIGHLPLADFQHAVQQRDLSTLCRVPGIGKKTAERLVIELRDKLQELIPPSPGDLALTTLDPRKQLVRDAMSTLINLGYTQIAAQKALKKVLESFNDEVDLPTLITHTLKHI